MQRMLEQPQLLSWSAASGLSRRTFKAQSQLSLP
jgi:hypothetical protein